MELLNTDLFSNKGEEEYPDVIDNIPITYKITRHKQYRQDKHISKKNKRKVVNSHRLKLLLNKELIEEDW
jgi:hypothetical protein